MSREIPHDISALLAKIRMSAKLLPSCDREEISLEILPIILDSVDELEKKLADLLKR